jgi:hypothetical protein
VATICLKGSAPLADRATGRKIGKTDLAPVRGIIHDPDRARNDKTDFMRVAATVEDLLTRRPPSPAAFHRQPFTLVRRQSGEQFDLIQAERIAGSIGVCWHRMGHSATVADTGGQRLNRSGFCDQQ